MWRVWVMLMLVVAWAAGVVGDARWSGRVRVGELRYVGWEVGGGAVDLRVERLHVIFNDLLVSPIGEWPVIEDSMGKRVLGRWWAGGDWRDGLRWRKTFLPGKWWWVEVGMPLWVGPAVGMLWFGWWWWWRRRTGRGFEVGEGVPVKSEGR